MTIGSVDVHHLIPLSWALFCWEHSVCHHRVYLSVSSLTQAWIHPFPAHGDAAVQAFGACELLHSDHPVITSSNVVTEMYLPTKVQQ